ncbi:MAG TPA: hypothetical protein VF791_11675 [Pyrinomonadaceae bacterium]
MKHRIYLIFGLAVVLLYGITGALGWEWGSSNRQVLPPDVRNSPGGYRSFHFWHSGFHGGK